MRLCVCVSFSVSVSVSVSVIVSVIVIVIVSFCVWIEKLQKNTTLGVTNQSDHHDTMYIITI